MSYKERQILFNLPVDWTFWAYQHVHNIGQVKSRIMPKVDSSVYNKKINKNGKIT